MTRAEGLQLAAKLTLLLERGRFHFPGENITLLGCKLHPHISRESRDIVNSKVKGFFTYPVAVDGRRPQRWSRERSALAPRRDWEH
jgi:hypothetical protein